MYNLKFVVCRDASVFWVIQRKNMFNFLYTCLACLLKYKDTATRCKVYPPPTLTLLMFDKPLLSSKSFKWFIHSYNSLSKYILCVVVCMCVYIYIPIPFFYLYTWRIFKVLRTRVQNRIQTHNFILSTGGIIQELRFYLN